MKKNLKLKKLNIKNLSQVVDLQSQVIDSMSEDEKHYFIHRSKEDFAKMLSAKTTVAFGLFYGEKLIGQAMLALPQNGEDRDIPQFGQEYKNSEIAIYKAVLVHKDYRGQGLMGWLIKAREAEAKRMGRKVAISLIAVDNSCSWINAVKSGMQIAQVGKNPRNGKNALYLKQDLCNVAKNIICEESMVVPFNVSANSTIMFNKMKNYINKGFVATQWNKKNNTIIWQQEEVANKSHDRTSLAVNEALSLSL